MIERSLAVICFCLAVAGPLATTAQAETGIASVYGYDGQKTANGERANPRGLTAAHKSLPFGTMVTVTNKKNGRQVKVRINDRGPFISGRIIDLTPAAASQLGFSGLAPVVISAN
jgi:rare lipoprotein A